MLATIRVDNGPESLVVDAARGRAYTHRWQASTPAIELNTRKVVSEWANGCAGSRGIDVEPEHGFVLFACNDGMLWVIDPEHEGKIVSTVTAGAGYDVIGYNRQLRHVYLAGGKCACLTTVGMSTSGELSVLRRVDAPKDTHCAVADERRRVGVSTIAGARAKSCRPRARESLMQCLHG